mmetsp:Transcript_29880/g.45534  ORF Transcript_29880/g.45534 Transcript_29880/m.45534 type:complete len:357 (+) Transcript_29880:114-1184(+)
MVLCLALFLARASTVLFALQTTASAALMMTTTTTRLAEGQHYNFLSEIDETIQRVLATYDNDTLLSNVPECERQDLVIARALRGRLQDMERKRHCPICWLQNNYCFCADCPPVVPEEEDPTANTLNRLFLVMHHGEIGMGVDTAKLILASHPTKCRLVVAGIGSKYQKSMKELEDTIANSNRNCLVLFPDEASKPFHEIAKEEAAKTQYNEHFDDADDGNNRNNNNGWNIIVIDGTWQQARRIKKRYFGGGEETFPSSSSSLRLPSIRTARLSDKVLRTLEQELVDGEINPGHQLRKHSSTSRKVGTFEAVRLFLGDLVENNKVDNDDTTIPSWIQIEKYQQIANNALQAQNGFPC